MVSKSFENAIRDTFRIKKNHLSSTICLDYERWLLIITALISRDLKNSNPKFPMYFNMFQDIYIRCQGFFVFTFCHSALI